MFWSGTGCRNECSWCWGVSCRFMPSQSDVCCEVGGGCDLWLSEVVGTRRIAWTVSYFRPNPTVGHKRTTRKTDSPSHLDGHILALLPCCHPRPELSSFHCLLLQLPWLLQKLCWRLGEPLSKSYPLPSPPPPNMLPCHPPAPTPHRLAQLGLPQYCYYYYEDCFAKLNQLWSMWASASDLKQQRWPTIVWFLLLVARGNSLVILLCRVCLANTLSFMFTYTSTTQTLQLTAIFLLMMK